MGALRRNANCLDLFLLVQSVAGMRLGSFKLIWGTEILSPNFSRCPFERSAETTFVLTVLRDYLDLMPVPDNSFADLVRRMPALALSSFLFSDNQRARVAERDLAGESPLAWALYKARQQPAAARLAAEILRRHPTEARFRNARTGFSPLHDAAWGHAPRDLAVLLCAIHPSAALQRSAQGELPDDVGHYHHRSFSWPAPQELIAEGAALRASTQQQCRFRLVRWLRADGILAPLNLPSRPATLVLGFLSHSEPLVSDRTRRPESGLSRATIESSLPRTPSFEMLCVESKRMVRSQKAPPSRRHGVHRSPRVRPVSLSDRIGSATDWLSDGEAAASDEADLDFLREEREKSLGKLAGSRVVRHRRCGFTAETVVIAGSSQTVHRLHLHLSHSVHREAWKPCGECKWPAKKALQLERAWERREKFNQMS